MYAGIREKSAIFLQIRDNRERSFSKMQNRAGKTDAYRKWKSFYFDRSLTVRGIRIFLKVNISR